MGTVLVTGANRGIGLEIVRQLAARGDTVLACCRQPGNATALAAIEGNVELMEVAVGSDDSVASLAQRLSGTAIDTLINNAGMSGPARAEQSVLNMDFDGWAETFNVNTLGPVRMMQALMPNLRAAESAKVMTVTSQMGALSLDMTVSYAYCTSKAAINKFMKMAGVELAREGIAVGLVHPGWVRTDMGGPNAQVSPEDSAAGVIRVTDGLDLQNAGSFWCWDGRHHDW